MDKVNDINIEVIRPIITPQQLRDQLPLTERAQTVVAQGREQVKAILEGKDHRLLVVVGPCSIHDPQAALDYAHRLKGLSTQVKDTLLLVMRVYFEKPLGQRQSKKRADPQ